MDHNSETPGVPAPKSHKEEHKKSLLHSARNSTMTPVLPERIITNKSAELSKQLRILPNVVPAGLAPRSKKIDFLQRKRNTKPLRS